MKVFFELSVIELTAAEMKEAQKYGSDMYRNLMDAKRDNPGFMIKQEKAKKVKNDFSDLNMKNITMYVAKHGTEEQKKNFATISKRTITEDGEYCEPQSFFEIKKWFLNEFPEIKQARKDYREKIKTIYDKAADKAEKANVEKANVA